VLREALRTVSNEWEEFSDAITGNERECSYSPRIAAMGIGVDCVFEKANEALAHSDRLRSGKAADGGRG